MKTYKPLYLIEIIQMLNDMPADALIQGFYGYVNSYRAYWERNALEYTDGVFDAHTVAKDLLGEIGKKMDTDGYDMEGSSTVVCKADEYTYLVKDPYSRRSNGMLIIGFEASHTSDDSRPVYVPIVLEDSGRI